MGGSLAVTAHEVRKKVFSEGKVTNKSVLTALKGLLYEVHVSSN